MMEEIWLPIPGFSLYQVSSMGRLKTFNWKGSGREAILRPAKSRDGYYKTVLKSDDGKNHSWGVHRWVAMAFIGEIPEGYEVNHINGDKSDNRADNLEYVTRSGNIIHAYRLALIKPKVGELNGMAKLTNDQVREIRDYVSKCSKRYYGRKELAQKYGVSECTIKEVVSRRRNKFYNV